MEVVFFIYGLAFFVLGIAIVFYPRRDSAFTLAGNLVYVAMFGLLHGINEWLDLFIMIGVPANSYPLELVRMLTLPVSFLCLVQFGVTVLSHGKRRGWLAQATSPVLLLIWVWIFATMRWDFHYGDIWARYLLCVPGTLLSAIALFVQLPMLERTGQVGIVRNARSAAVVFMLYGILAGVIVKGGGFFPASVLNYAMVLDLLGFPVQILRAACALVLAYNFVRILQLFRWEQQRALSQSRQRLQTVITHSPIILFATDNQAKVTFIEGKGLDSLKINARDALDREIADVFCNSPEIARDVSRAIGGEEVVSNVYLGELVLEMHYSPLTAEPGFAGGVIGVAVDITDTSKARAELDKYRHGMRKTQQLASLGTIGASMAGELVEPLRMAKVLLLKSISSLRVMKASGHVLSRLNGSLQEVSKAGEIVDKFCEASNIKPLQKAQAIDLYEIVQRILAVFEDNAHQAGLRLVASGTDIVPCMFISPHELEQIFFTMVQEAIYSAHCEKQCQLVISCQISKGFLHVKFIDNCGGLAPNKLAAVFEPFAAQSRSHEPGLALAIVKQLVTANGGEVDVESEPGRGTTFHIRLPVEQPYE